MVRYLQGAGHPPSFLEKTQAIIDFFEDPCDAPWIVYLQLARAPLGHVALQLIGTSMTDIVRAYFRPKGLRRGGHMRLLGRKGRRRGFGIPDTAELIGHHIPGQKAIASRQISDGVRHLWMIDGVIQRGLWYWMVADLTNDFFYEWTSAVMRSEECSRQRPGMAFWEGGPGSTTGRGWVPYGNAIRSGQNGNCFTGPLFEVNSPGGSARAGARATGDTDVLWDHSYCAVWSSGEGTSIWVNAVQGLRGYNPNAAWSCEHGWFPDSTPYAANQTVGSAPGQLPKDGVLPTITTLD